MKHKSMHEVDMRVEPQSEDSVCHIRNDIDCIKGAKVYY